MAHKAHELARQQMRMISLPRNKFEFKAEALKDAEKEADVILCPATFF